MNSSAKTEISENKHLKLITYKNSHENTMQEVFDFYKEKNLLKRSLKQ